MIFYKTIKSLNSDIIPNGTIMNINNQQFSFTGISDGIYSYKVRVDNENGNTLSALSNTSGVIILSQNEFNSL